MTASFKSRGLLACFALACIFTVFSVRLVHLQVTMAPVYRAQAAGNHGSKQVISARRGAILDIHGQSLAQNEPVKTVIADASHIPDREAMADLLAESLGMKRSAVLEKLSREYFSKREGKLLPVRYIILRKDVPESVATLLMERLAAAKMRGISFEQECVRVYPNTELLCHVVGFTNHENSGVDGIERTMDEYLRGHDGFRFMERDGGGHEIVAYRGLERTPRNGNNVRLTIDMGLQMIVEDELEDACKQYRPKMAVAMLVRPQTGEILALANRPNFDLNNVDKSPLPARRNRAITDMVEPGSTFKIVPVSAALEKKLVNPNTMIFCENGAFRYMGRTLNDTHPHPELSVHDILVQSSNIGAAKLGIQLGEQRLYEYVRRYGFGEPTGVQLPGEIRGMVHAPHHWSEISITRLTMGQEVGATPLQIAMAMATIANGGRLMQPQIVHDVVDENGNVVAAFSPVEVRRVVSEKAAAQVRDALVDVTGKKGTAKGAQVPGYKVAGKTGTAQKVGEGGVGYERGKYVVSFAGFMPAENPEFVCLVLVDDAVTQPGMNYGGLVAAPIFAKIAARAARYLNIPPTPELPEPGNLLSQARATRD